MELSEQAEIAVEYLTTLGAMNLTRAESYMHADFKCYLPNLAISQNTFSKTEFAKFLTGVSKILKGGIDFDYRYFTEQDNRLSIVADGRAVAINGQPYNNTYHFLLIFSNSRIVEHHEFADTFLAAKVLGPLLSQR